MNLFKDDGTHIILDAPYCEFYIPMYYFEDNSKFAEDKIDIISILAVFNIGIFENGNFKELRTFNLPTFADIRVYQSEERSIKLKSSENPIKCKVLKYNKGNIIMNSSIIEDSDSSQSYLNFIISGSLPETIPYTRSLEIWRKNLELNKVSFGVSSTILELVLSVVYRNKQNPELKFSRVFGADLSVSEYEYQLASIRQICQYASTFTAITYEDIDTMITNSINRGRDGGEEAETPIEKLIKM